MTVAAAYATRTATASAVKPSTLEGMLQCSPDAGMVTALCADAVDHVVAVHGDALAATGVSSDDRVLVALNNDGDGPAPWLTRAAAGVAAAVASVGPRGRMRLLRAMQTIAPTTLVMTPCGAADLLSRLHMEFLVDPQELGLRRLILLGEISSSATYQHLAEEFDVEVHELWCDPFVGAALAHRRPQSESGFTPVRPGIIELADLAHDGPASGATGDLAEWVVRPVWSTPAENTLLRSGWVGPSAGHALPAPEHTVGSHVLVRGRWVSLEAIDGALQRIDGVTSWTLELSRPGTLDRAELHVVLGRPTLIDNPMWGQRIRDAIAGTTPVHVECSFHAEDDYEDRHSVRDHRGHHLGDNRATVVAESAGGGI